MKKAITHLIQLGLSEYEAKAYVTLLRENPLTAYEIAKNSQIPSSKVYEVIRRLESRQMVQIVHGERSKMYIPISPDELVQSFRLITESNLDAVIKELKHVKAGFDTSYTWHIKDYESLIIKAKRMLDTSQQTILISTWPAEVSVLSDFIRKAELRGIQIAIVHYGATNIKCGQIYRHPVEDTIFARSGTRGFSMVVDSKEVLIGRVEDKETEAIWSMNKSFVLMAEDYIRHDIYVMKIVKRFDPLLKEKFGSRYENLRNVYWDEEISR
jgi:sugar-specific transcriptional regulator TrmB